MSNEELRALAEMHISLTDQVCLDQLVAKNTSEQLTDAEARELDRMLRQIDQLSLLKARARYTFQQRAALLLAA